MYINYLIKQFTVSELFNIAINHSLKLQPYHSNDKNALAHLINRKLTKRQIYKL